INSTEMRMPRTIGLPPKMAGSLAILSSWPKLASDACCDGATATHVAKYNAGQRSKPLADPEPAACRSLSQQNPQRLPIRDLRPFLQLRHGATADRMPHHQEGISGQAHDPGDVARCHLERFSAQHHRAFAKLFEADAVMQTA